MKVDAPFAQRAGEFAAVGIHRGVVVVIVCQTQVVDLVRQLVHFQNDAVVIHLRDGRQAGDIFGKGATGSDQARVVHVAQAGVGAFQQRGGGGDVLIAPQLTSSQFDQEISLRQQPGFGIGAGDGRHFLLHLIQLLRQFSLLTVRVGQLGCLLFDHRIQLGFLRLLCLLQSGNLSNQRIAGGGLVSGLFFHQTVQADACGQRNGDSNRA